MLERAFSMKADKKPSYTPHGLSRDKGQGSFMPLALGLACAVGVLLVLWLAYTYG